MKAEHRFDPARSLLRDCFHSDRVVGASGPRLRLRRSCVFDDVSLRADRRAGAGGVPTANRSSTCRRLARIGSQLPWTADTAATLFSATKGIHFHRDPPLADRGLIHYDAPVAEYWLEFGANGESDLTVRRGDVTTPACRVCEVRRREDLLDHVDDGSPRCRPARAARRACARA